MAKLRHEVRCGYCNTWMNVGTDVSREFGTPWHISCVRLYVLRRQEEARRAMQQRALAASGGRNLRA